MKSGPKNSLTPSILAVLVSLLLGACQVQIPKNSALSRLNALPDIPPTAVMIVIDDPRSERRRRGVASPGYNANLAYSEDPALARIAKNIVSHHALQIIVQWPLRNLPVHCLVIEQPSVATLDALRRDSRIKWLQPFNHFDTQSPASSISAKQNTGTRNTQATTFSNRLLNETSDQGAGVRIAVIDTSTDTTHPDLSNSPIKQFNFAGNRGRLREEAHGTAVVGLISAMPATPNGVRGFAQQADVQVLRACWQTKASEKGKCNTLTLALALDAAIDLKPEVVNLSLTGHADRVLEELLSELLNRGSLVVAAWDDNRTPNNRFPAGRAGVVYAYGSESGSVPTQDNVLSAPRHALSLAPMAGYDLVSGHSIAAPQISALAAQLINRKPEASRAEIISQLKDWLSANQIVQ